jgi:pilus assembly protein FimV
MGNAADDAGMDFNLDIGGAEEPAAAEEVSVADLDFDLDTGSDTADAGLDFNIGGGEDEISLDMDSGSSDDMMDLNLDASDTADADIGDGDEVGTKLDLAKAYIDMGDPEGARSILDEVMDEGSATQKEEAQSLLGQIA